MGRYRSFLSDFAQRTRTNMREVKHISDRPGPSKAYEFTQAVNSLLGLVVLPRERSHARNPEPFRLQMPEWDADEMRARGIPIDACTIFKRKQTFPQLVIQMRNAVGHFNMEVQDDGTNIRSVTLWNEDKGERYFEICLEATQLYDMIEVLADVWTKPPEAWEFIDLSGRPTEERNHGDS